MKTVKFAGLAIISLFMLTTAYADEPQMHGVIVTKSRSDIHDVLIKTRVQTAYSLNPLLNHFNLDVDVKDSKVAIKGAVQNEIQKELALAIAQSDKDVLAVTDKIKIDPRTKLGEIPNSYGQKVKDATLTAMVKSKLALDSKTKAAKITVTSVNNVMTLEGDVTALAVKEQAEQVAIRTLGVSTVRNYLTVNGK